MKEAQIAFIRAPAIKRWAVDGGPARRRQEIPEEDRITGRLPKGKIVSLSHCWDATCNCDPTGKKMAELQLALEELGATGDEDAVFIDYCSLPQMAPRHAPAHLTRDVNHGPSRFPRSFPSVQDTLCLGGKRIFTIEQCIFRY